MMLLYSTFRSNYTRIDNHFRIKYLDAYNARGIMGEFFDHRLN